MSRNRIASYFENTDNKVTRANKTLQKPLLSTNLGQYSELPDIISSTPYHILYGKLDYLDIRAYYDFIVNAFNAAFDLFGLKIVLRFDRENMDKLTRDQDRALFDGDARLHITTIITVADSVAKLLAKKNFCIKSLTQTCKTATQSLAAIIGSVVSYLKTGRPARPIMLTPNSSSLEKQFKGKYRDIYVALSGAIISYKGKVAKDSDLLDLFPQIPNRLSSVPRNQRSFMTIEGYFQDLDDIIKFIGKNHSTTKRSNKAWKQLMAMKNEPYIIKVGNINRDLIDFIVEICIKNDISLYLFRDESHYGVDPDSVNDKMMKKEYEHMGEYYKNSIKEIALTIYNLVNSYRCRVQWIGCSATEFLSGHLSDVEVRGRIEANYCGININLEPDGETWGKFTDVPIRSPEIITVDDLADRVGNPLVAFLCDKDYRSPLNGDATPDYVEEHRNDCAKAMADVIEYCLFEKNKHNHRGMLIRYLRANIHNDDFVLRLNNNGLAPKVKIIEFYGKEMPSVKELLAEKNVGPDDFYVIFVSSRARMGDSFPIDCGYGIDFCPSPASVQSIIQGVLGRMTGYDKFTTVVLGQKNYDRIQVAIRGEKMKGSAIRKNHKGTIRINRTKTFYSTNRDPLIQKIFRRINEKILGKKDKNPGSKNYGKYPREAGRSMEVDFFDQIISASDLSMIEEKYDDRFLRPNETNIFNGFTYSYDNTGFNDSPRISLRQDHTGGKSRSNNKSGIQDRTAMLVILVVENPGKESMPMTCLEFQLYRYLDSDHGGKVSQNPKSVPEQIQNEEE